MDHNMSFDNAVAALYSPLHQSRTREAIEKAALRRTKTVDDMRTYMKRAEINDPKCPIIHITGTKGKGSTACMCESIARTRHGATTGLFTSPHLVDIRERIRVNGKPVSKKVFAQAYWHLREKLEGFASGQEDLPQLPGYFRMLALMAFYIFSMYEPALDVLILEVGMGGRYDATNVFDTDRHNVVCGVTLLDLDHTRVLGETLQEIAWEKGGIFQVHKGAGPTSPRPFEENTQQDLPTTTSADSSPRLFVIGTNPPSTINVLRQCALVEGQGQSLGIVQETDRSKNKKLGLQGDHQRINAELAMALCETVMTDLGEEAMDKGLETAFWPGRCHTVVHSDRLLFRLDGAHTPKSVRACLAWFRSNRAAGPLERILVFNCSHERNPVPLLQLLQSAEFHRVFFCPADFERPSATGKPNAKDLLLRANISVSQHHLDPADTWQDTLAQIWKQLEGASSQPCIVKTNQKVGNVVKEITESILPELGERRIEVCVAGSLYIVGSALDALGWKEGDASGGLRT